ncbi:hypothetical protein CWS02_08145 [Enterobacter sp. EA-1]|nr:hypothetical protein CWS02_08145 [Enterobacter sp. EA-1]
MFGRSGDENAAAYERLAELTGMLTEDERALIDSLFPERHAAPVAEPASPFSANEIAELEAIVAELADDDISSEFSSDDIASQPSEGATAMAEESPRL